MIRVAIASLLVLSAPAFADAPRPAFTHLGPDGHGHEVSVDASVLFPTEDGAGFVSRLKLTGQGMSNDSGLGIYGTIALSRWFLDDEDSSALGGLEAGIVYRLKDRRDDLDSAMRFGVVLPTADEDDDYYTQLFTTYYQDISNLAQLETWKAAFRVAGTSTYHRGNRYARADAGFDLLLSSNSDRGGSLLHLDLAAGLAPAPVGAAIELQSMCSTDWDRTDQCSHVVALDGQLAVGRSVLVLGAGVPFGTRDDLATVNVELGFHGRF